MQMFMERPSSESMAVLRTGHMPEVALDMAYLEMNGHHVLGLAKFLC